MVFVFFQRGVAPGIPAQLHPAFFQSRCNTARGDFFIAVDVLNEVVDDRDHRLHEAHCGLKNLRAVLGQTHCQPGNAYPNDTQHQAN
ncbi:hypothetical protein D3C84_1139900 [compost metagenome]